jgi:hypothetical protein
MSVANIIDTRALVRHFAEAIAHFNAPVAEVWLREAGETVEVWIITEPVELDGERLVAQAAAQLQDAFPDRYLNVTALNPSVLTNELDPHEMLPAGVERLMLLTAG